MGVFCPLCKTHQPIVQNITADMGPVTKNNPVVARKLGCGHQLNGERYAAYVAEINRIRAAAFERETVIREQMTDEMAKAWARLSAEGGTSGA